jgi:hypothetical protein
MSTEEIERGLENNFDKNDSENIFISHEPPISPLRYEYLDDTEKINETKDKKKYLDTETDDDSETELFDTGSSINYC